MPLSSISRRGFTNLTAGFALTGCAPAPTLNPIHNDPTAQQLGELERRAGGKLGVCIFAPSTGAMISHRGNERVGMASTFKLALAAIILHEADQGRLSLMTQLPISQSDVLANSPLIEENLASGSMSIEALAKAAQTRSDNGATNILLRHIGGLSFFNQKLRELGDLTTRLDRFEPEMNRVMFNDERDTTTPEAMSKTIAKMLLTDYLTPATSAHLIGWMIETRTGLKRLRAGLPQDWKSGDKTGTATGYRPTDNIPDRYNDIAITWPADVTIMGAGPAPQSASPMIISAYYQSPVVSQTMRDEDQAVLASVGVIAASWHRLMLNAG